MVKFRKVTVGVLRTNCYIVYDETLGKGIIIDPGGESDKIIKVLDELNVKIEYIIATHGHFDHVLCVDTVKEYTNSRFIIHEADVKIMEYSKIWVSGKWVPPKPDILLDTECTIRVSDTLKLNILYTPGHTPGSICIHINNMLFTGDTLFKGTIGRTDIPGGSFKQILKSLEKIKRLPRNTLILPGHGSFTTLDQELKYNPYLSKTTLGTS